MQSCRLVARHTKLVFRYFLTHWIDYATLKSASSHRQNLLAWDSYRHVCWHLTCNTKTCIFIGVDTALPSRSPVTWWQNVIIWLCVIKNIRLAFDSNRNIFTLQSHKLHMHFSDLCRQATFYTLSCHLVAILKYVSSQRQHSTIGGGYKKTCLLTFDL